MPVQYVPIIVIFNLVVLLALAATCRTLSLKNILREKAAPPPVAGAAVDNTSFSRLAGAIGAIVLAAFFWAIANVILVKALSVPDQITELKDLVSGAGTFMAAGAALFAPYAFNQLGQLFKPGQ